MFPIKSYAGQSISISSDRYESMCKKWYFIKNVYSQDLAYSESVKQLLSFIDDQLMFRQISATGRVSKFLSKESNVKLFNSLTLPKFL